MMSKTSDRKWEDQNGTIYDNLYTFENINDKVEHQVGDLSTNLESAIGNIKYKIENEQLSIFGINISNSFIFEICFVLSSLIIGII